MRTFTQDFKRDDGTPVTVEYGVEGSYSPTTYSPHSGACGGDAPEFSILKCWPNTPEHEALNRELMQLDLYDKQGASISSLVVMAGDEGRQGRIEELKREIEQDEERVVLTDAERERMESWLAEHYVEDEPCDLDVF